MKQDSPNIKANTIREEPVQRKRSRKSERPVQTVLDGTFLASERTIRMLPFLLFLAFLGILYIANIYYAEKRIRKINETHRELKELRYEYITGKTRMEDQRKQSEVAKKLEGSGIKELTVPPAKMIVPPLKREDP
jgi:hypothetical protein